MSIQYGTYKNAEINESISLNLPETTKTPLFVHGHIHKDTALDKFQKDYAGVHGYLSVCVCLFGITSNFANIVVLTRKNMITSTNIILTWLAVADTLKMTDYLPFVTHFYIQRDPEIKSTDYFFASQSKSWMYYLMFHASFAIVCHTIAIWLTISLAIFRFLYIWYPTRGNMWCSPRRAKIVIFTVYIAVAIICSPNYAMNNFEEFTKNNSVVLYRYIKSKSFDNTTFDHLNYYIQSILVKIVPCFMLTILTFLLIYAMHKAYLRRRALKSEGRTEDANIHHEHNRTTGMLLAVVVLFLITELPQGILTLLMTINPLIENDVYNPLGDMLDIVALCNNGVNFILYCSMSKQFRDTFVSIFCGCCTKKETAWSKIKLITSAKNGHRDYSTATHATHV
ncbi:hypothetical protein FSP39_006374 [Pinctada imbricata]|uniref:G-protein coupled receptors family 1 profile domain-containing protein n=1 Tax=Pinctada imbricata TaxID=66713 RepID=A0AA89BT53_PINIB|nr:hypothetical protein FSP39_006374 [Pinctada imbricata]